MRRNKNIYLPSTSDIKILITVEELNKDNLYPLPQGVFKILSASGEDEFLAYRHLSTYGTLLSYSSKHISRLIMMLVRNKYLEKIYDRNTDSLCLKISSKGTTFLLDYRKKHKYLFIKKEANKKPLIIEIK